MPFEVCVPKCDEVQFPADPVATVGINALAKARSVRASHPGAVILAADTVVCFQGQVLGKPKDPEQAQAWLLAYAGKSQTVYTAVAFLLPEAMEPELRIEATSLTFKAYDSAVAQAYLESVKPFDRAGAYDINVHGDWLIERRVGSFSNVMGLPRGVVRDWLMGHGLLPIKNGEAHERA